MTSPVNFTETRGGYVYGYVRGLSMWPALIPGDLLRAAPAAVSSLEPGEIVVMRSGPEVTPVVHRLVKTVRIADGTVELHTAGDRGGADQPFEKAPDDTLLRLSGLLRRSRWRQPIRAMPEWICRLPAIFVRLHCALVRRLEW